MDFPQYFPLLLAALTGVMAGFLNTLAGGGSLLTLPVLNFIGLDLGIANATNRFSILCQNFSAMWLYQSRGEIEWKSVFKYVVPAVFGAFFGTLTAIYIPPKVFRITAAISIAVMGILLAGRKSMWETPSGTPLSPFMRNIALFFSGMYGGFLQAGVGFFLIWAIVGGCKKNIKEANVIKIVVVAIYTVLSLLIFASFNMVNWTAAAALAAGSVTGGNIGARFNLTIDKRYLHLILTFAVFISATKIIWDTIR